MKDAQQGAAMIVRLTRTDSTTERSAWQHTVICITIAYGGREEEVVDDTL